MADLPLGRDGLPLPNIGNPDYVGERKYFVTLFNKEDEPSFIQDMSSPTGTDSIPNRVVNVIDKFKYTKSSSYMISYTEAVNLTKDPRVKAVELDVTEYGAEINVQNWTSTDTFSKGFVLNGTDKNWGLFRTLSKNNTANWGSGNNTLPSTTIYSELTGKNVDVVVFDTATPWSSTYEFWQNSNASGYSRQVLFKWQDIGSSYIPIPTLYPAGAALVYNDHNSHTTGTAAGNSQGFARDANIYNGVINLIVMDNIIEFHNSKPVNPALGVKNPTITNNSWGIVNIVFSASGLLSWSDRINYRGTDYFPTSGTPGNYIWDDNVINTLKFPSQLGNGLLVRDTATDDAFIVAAKAGIINVVAAGNSYSYVDVFNGPDYNNYINCVHPSFGGVFYYNRGMSPSAAIDTSAPDNQKRDYSPISVGAIGAVQTGPASNSTARILYDVAGYTSATGLLSTDYKSEFSNYGPGVDVFAPGECITSVIRTSAYRTGYSTGKNILDPRNSTANVDSYNNIFNKKAGTSMSCPHVTGVLACILEQFPTMTQPQARQWIAQYSQPTLQSTNGGSYDATDSSGSLNRVLYMPQMRFNPADVGGFRTNPYPNTTNSSTLRTSNGQAWPPLVPRRINNNQTYSLSADRTNINTISNYSVSLPSSPIIANTSTPASMFIDGNSNYLPFTGACWVDAYDSTNVGMFGTGDWTFECFLNFYILPDGNVDQPNINQYVITCKGLANTPELMIKLKSTPWVINYPNFDYNHYIEVSWNGGANSVQSSYLNIPYTAVPGAEFYHEPYYFWHHLAVVKTGDNVVIYWNGQEVSTPTSMTSWTDNVPWITIGRQFWDYSPTGSGPPINVVKPSAGAQAVWYEGFCGFISNLRICKGVAVYTGNFTVPTTMLNPTQSSGTNIAAITGSQCTLLTGQFYEPTGITCQDRSNFSSTNKIGQWVATKEGAGNAPILCDNIGNVESYQYYKSTLTRTNVPFTVTGTDTANVTITTTGIKDNTVIRYIISSTHDVLSEADVSSSIGTITSNSKIVGNTIVVSNQAVVPITFTGTKSIPVTFRLDIFGTDTITFKLNYT
jgi:Subtilase family